MSALAGRDALVCSSTFNRNESPLTARAAEERWRQDAVGPLFPWQPLRKGSRAGEREQRRLLGAVVTGWYVDPAGEWRMRVFDSVTAEADCGNGSGRMFPVLRESGLYEWSFAQIVLGNREASQ